MELKTSHTAQIQLSAGEWFRVRVAPPDHVTGVMEVYRAAARWSSDDPRPVLLLVGHWVNRNGRTGRLRTRQTIFTSRPDGERVVRQLPEPFVRRLEAEGMKLH
ncbi:hypothetical protein [Streptomyces sp. NPDC003952]